MPPHDEDLSMSWYKAFIPGVEITPHVDVASYQGQA